MAINGINHLNLSVRDLDVSFHFYQNVLGFRPLAKWDEGAYFLVGELWFCINLDAKVRAQALPEYTHIAFNVTDEEFDGVSLRVQQSGARIWKENSSEGRSLYFLDPSGHKLELHSSDWRARIESAKRDPAWQGTQFFI